jgi:phosphatidylglycerophosphate synthase
MLDGLLRPKILPAMDSMAIRLSQSGLSANALTLIGFAFGFAGCFSVGMQMYPLGLILILIGRFFDGLDGGVARATSETDLGAFLDMFCDYTVYAAFPFFFMLSSTEHSMAAAILLLSYLLMGMAYLSYNFYALKRGMSETTNGGFVESAEMMVFIALCCFYPPGFSAFAAVFALMCLATSLWRVIKTIKLLKA